MQSAETYTTPPGITMLPPPLSHIQTINRMAWSPDGRTIAAPSDSQAIRLWDMHTRQRLRTLTGHTGFVYSVAWSPDNSMLASASSDSTVRLWNINVEQEPHVLKGHIGDVYSVAWSSIGNFVASGAADGTIRLWDGQTGQPLHTQFDTPEPINCVAWSPVESVLASSSSTGIILWDVNAGKPLRTLMLNPASSSGSAQQIYNVAWSPDGAILASASADCTVRLWESSTGRQIRILEGHTGVVTSVVFSYDSRFLASKARDKTTRIWRTDTWQPITTQRDPGTTRYGFSLSRFSGLAFHPNSPILATLGDQDRSIYTWALDPAILLSVEPERTSMYYTNAKIALVGDSGVGKSSLGMVLTGQQFVPTESTHGRKVWPFDNQEVQLADGHRETRETLLWDLAGQPGYRLIHQLHMSEVSVALIIFDARSETDPFAGVHHWANALRVAQCVQGASAPPMKKFLVSARIDRSGASASFARIEAVMQELDIDEYYQVSAKDDVNIDMLAQAIKRTIEWDRLPKVTSTDLFQRIKDFLVHEKDAERLLSSVEDLYRTFLRFEGILVETEDLRAQFETCIGRVEAKGLIRRFSFGDLVLLQPEWLDAYASALVNSAREEPDGLGSILEAKARTGNFAIPQGERLKDKKQEELLLIAMVEDLLHYEIALREQSDEGPYLVFLFQSTRENLDLPTVQERERSIIFRFEGPVLNVYATLAVRLSHSGLFIKQDLWRNAITYTTRLGGTYGLFLNNTGLGSAELILFFNEDAREETCFHFEAFVKTHLERHVLPTTINRRRVFICPRCTTPVTDLQANRRKQLGFGWIQCNVCDTTIPLHDGEQRLASIPPSLVVTMNEAANKQRDRITAQLSLQGKIATNDFDVFLCHNGQDKAAVKKIATQLKEHGILPWLDEWQLRPGMPWQQALEQQIEHIKAAAVFVGSDGFGPWQRQEMAAFLNEFIQRGCPVIPILLEGAPIEPQLPLFLKNMTWVDFRKHEPEPMKQLLWGITGEQEHI